MAEEKTIVLPLNDGITETVADETANGIVSISNNTRLTVLKGTTVRRPAINALASVAAGSVCGGFASAGDGSVAAYFRPKVGQKRIYDTTMAGVNSTLIWGTPQNAYFPYPLDLADGLTGMYGYQPAVTADASGNVWTLSVRTYNSAGAVALFVQVVDQFGKVIVPSQRITTLGSTGWPSTAMKVTSWCGLTSHGGTGVVAWYLNDTEYRGVLMTLNAGALDITYTGNSSIHTPAAMNKSVTQLYHFAEVDVTVDPDNTQYAYFACKNTAADTAVDVLKVDVTTMTVVSTLTIAARFTTGAGNQQHVALSAWSIGSTRYLAVMTSDRNTGGAAVGTYLALVNQTTMTVTWTKTPVDLPTSGYVAPLPYYYNGTLYVIGAVTRPNLGVGTAIGTSTDVRTTFYVFDIAGTPGSAPVVYWNKLAARGAYYKVSDTEIYPFFPLQPEYNLTAAVVAPGSLSWVADPSIEIYSLSDVSYPPTPVMRCAVDRAANKDAPQNSGNCSIVGGKLYLSYLETKNDQAYSDGIGMRGRYVRFDLAPTTQPSVANDEGVAIVGSGLVGVWDGNETTEYAPLHQPKINVVTTGGTGPNLTGTWSFTAVVSYRDKAGLYRCSQCATPVTVSPAGTKPIVYVTIPSTMRNGSRQDEFECVIYATGDLSSGGTTLFYAQNMDPSDKTTNGVWTFNNVPTPNLNDILLDTWGQAGQTLLPVSPPPAHHVCVGNARLWVVDAENRNRLLPSMTKRSFRPYEFAGELEILVPTSHGKLVGCANNGGTIAAFAERGIWIIPGYGPDNAGQGGSFGDPRLVYNMGCRSRESIVEIPGTGVMFQRHDGIMCILSGGDVKAFETIDDIYAVGTPSVNLSDNEVVYPVAPGLMWLVYNSLADGWTKWPYTTPRPITSVASLQLQYTGTFAGTKSRTLQYAPSTGELEYVDSTVTSTDTNHGQSITRGWIVPEGPHGDCRIREIWYHARWKANHGLSITVAYDYVNVNSLSGYEDSYTKTWTATEIVANLASENTYTVGINCRHLPARAVKVTITEVVAGDSAGDAMNPLSLTIFYGSDGPQRRRTLRAGALK